MKYDKVVLSHTLANESIVYNTWVKPLCLIQHFPIIVTKVDGKLNRREWELIHHQLSYGIAVSMISLIKDMNVDRID